MGGVCGHGNVGRETQDQVQGRWHCGSFEEEPVMKPEKEPPAEQESNQERTLWGDRERRASARGSAEFQLLKEGRREAEMCSSALVNFLKFLLI